VHIFTSRRRALRELHNDRSPSLGGRGVRIVVSYLRNAKVAGRPRPVARVHRVTVLSSVMDACCAVIATARIARSRRIYGTDAEFRSALTEVEQRSVIGGNSSARFRPSCVRPIAPPIAGPFCKALIHEIPRHGVAVLRHSNLRSDRAIVGVQHRRVADLRIESEKKLLSQ
jgi:hypothetical protein